MADTTCTFLMTFLKETNIKNTEGIFLTVNYVPMRLSTHILTFSFSAELIQVNHYYIVYYINYI